VVNKYAVPGQKASKPQSTQRTEHETPSLTDAGAQHGSAPDTDAPSPMFTQRSIIVCDSSPGAGGRGGGSVACPTFQLPYCAVHIVDPITRTIPVFHLQCLPRQLELPTQADSALALRPSLHCEVLQGPQRSNCCLRSLIPPHSLVNRMLCATVASEDGSS